MRMRINVSWSLRCNVASKKRAMKERLVLLACLLGLCLPVSAGTYVVDASVGLGRRFDGIGGLSGGGVS